MLHTKIENKELKKVITSSKIKAINKQSESRCGSSTCNHKLGEFTRVFGTIKCPKCGTMNVVKL